MRVMLHPPRTRSISISNSNFVKKTLEHFPSLVLSRDFNGDTALHDAARRKARGVRAMVRICVRCMRNIANMNLDNVVHNSPWKAKNSKGNNALHEAMRTSNHKIIDELFKVDPSLALDKNNIGETPLHVFAKYATYTVDDTLDIIRHMLGSNADSAYQKDADGLTPAVRAAKYGRIRVAGLILQTLPQSIDVRDSNGRTFLHLLNIMHLELVDAAEDTTALCQILFYFPGVDSLRTAQDQDGNTPLHLALKTRNFVTAKVLMQRCLQSKIREELNIINGDGHSIFNLLSSLQANKSDDKEFEAMALLSIKIKERTSLENTMEIELYEAVVEGDVEIFDDYKDDVEGEYESEDRSYFMAQTPDGSSIVHTALKMGEKNIEAFLEEALNQFPSLICRRDYNGDTPLHLAAKWSSLASTKLLWLAVKSFSQAIVENTQHVTGVVLPPWMVKNSQGNMPIHEAIINGNIYAAEFLNNADPEAASYVNEAGETALHVYARCGQYSFQDKLEFLERLIEKNISAAHIRDNEGLTPLLRSAKCGKFRVAQTILKHCPLSAQLYDPKGRNFLHLLRLDVEFGETSFDVVYIMLSKQLFEVPEVDALRTEQDRDGNAPLQYALKTGNFVTAKVLAQRCCKNEFIREFHLVNNENERLEDLLRSTETPTEIVKLFRKKVPSFVSSYGIRKTEIKDSVNSLSVIAALLATMTFAAALQVPGGFNSEEGTPVLLTRSAFQIFLVADIVAMCGSMLVLFCLLWVLGTGKTADSLILIDFAFFLLQGSFYATLLAFMTGVYVYTVGKTSWVAIFVCVLCSTVMLLSWKTSILFLTKSIRLVINGVMNLRTRSFKDIVAIGTTLFFGNETSDDESGDDESRPQQQQQQQQQQQPQS